MAGEMKIRITADASQATTTMKATQANINKIVKDQPGLEKAFVNDSSQKNLDAINKNLSNTLELIERAAKAIHKADPTISEAEAKTKILSATMESLGREYGGAATESMKYLESLKEAISIEQKNINLLIEKTEAQKKYNTSVQEGIAKAVTGSGEYNAMGLAYNIPETYAETYSKLLEEKDMQEKQALLDDWLAAKKEHEVAITNVEKIAQEERFNQYKQSLKEKEAEDKAYYKSIEEEVKATEEREKKEAEYLKSVNESLDKAKEIAEAQNNIATATKAVGTAAKTSSNYFLKLFDTTKNILMFRVIMNIVNSLAKLNDFMGDSVQAAAEAEQIYSKLNTTFGKTSQAMSKAISLASKLGVATSTAASALSTVGDLLQAQGQTTIESLSTASEWVSQFQDIIAFKDINMSLEEFAQNFMSGAAGNLRNFRTFGSIVRESAVNAELAKRGLDKLTGSELELAKMTVRAEMALEQQKNAMGAAQREWDSMLSIQRRYEEAVKQFQENIGDSLSPVVKMWTELKTAMLEVFTAQETWNKKLQMVEEKKALDVKYATFEGGEDDAIINYENYLGFRSYVDAAKIDYVNAKNEEEQQKALEALQVHIQEYGASINNLKYALKDLQDSGFGVPSDFWEDAIKFTIDYQVELMKIKKEQKDINASITEANLADAFLEQLQTLRGVDLSDVSTYKTFTNTLDAAQKDGKITKESIDVVTRNALDYALKDAFKDISKVELSLTEKTFSEDPYLDVLETRRDLYKQLYELAANSGKYEESQVEFIAEGWKEANKQIDTYNETKSKIAELESGTANYKKQLEQLGMTDYEKTMDDFARMLKSATDPDLKIAILDQKAAFVKLTEATEAQTKAQIWEDLFDSLENTYAPIGVFVDGIIGSVKGVMDGISKGEGFWGKLWGGISGVFSGNAKGTLESENLEKVLMNILSKTEAFQELMSMVDTYIIPVIDQFLKPLLPLIDYFGKILQNTLLSFLEWFWPIMQGIAIGLTYIMGGINAVSQLISDSIKSLIGNVVVMFYKVIDAILWGDQSAPSWARDWADIKVWDNFQNNLKGIEDAVNDIKNNTLSIDSNVEELNEDDYETYRRLLQAREITDEQFKRLTHQDVYSTKTVGNGIEYTSGGKKSYVSINSLTVQVPAGMTLEEFLKNLGDYSNGNLPFGVNTISA